MLGSGELCNVLGWGRGDSQTQHYCCSRSCRKKGLSVRWTHRDSWTRDKCLRVFFLFCCCVNSLLPTVQRVWAFPCKCSCSQERQWIRFAFFCITENHFAKSVLAKRTSKRTATQNVSRKSQLKMFVPTFLLWCKNVLKGVSVHCDIIVRYAGATEHTSDNSMLQPSGLLGVVTSTPHL